MTTQESTVKNVRIIRRTSAWQFINFRELYAYRDMLRFLTWRSIKARYAQSAIGIGWAIIQPLFQMLMFTVIFGSIAKIDSGGAPYALFSLVGLVPWTYFSNALAGSSGSLVSNAGMISKVYFPRIILPLSDVIAKLFDFAIALVLAWIVLLCMGYWPGINALLLPYLLLLMMITSLGIGLWLTALAIQFRDVAHALGFVIQLMMYASPVIYPTTSVPEALTLPVLGEVPIRTLYALNPMVGVIEGFRAIMLGTEPVPYVWIGLGTGTALVSLLTGLMYFRSREKVFADVV